MARHLLNIADLQREDIDHIFRLADDGPQSRSLSRLTFLSVFFQESTRTRLGFMSAAARQGATVLDAGRADQLRVEPRDDQLMVLASVAELVAVRHWDAKFAHDLALREQCSVVNAGAGAVSHPTQSLIDAYTLTRALRPDLAGLRVLFLGPLLRSAVSFRELAAILNFDVSQQDVMAIASRRERERCIAAIEAADVVYVQSLSDTRYDRPELNPGLSSEAFPPWVDDAIDRSTARIMHALPRGPELPDRLRWSERSLVTAQLERGLAVRSAVLRWLVDSY